MARREIRKIARREQPKVKQDVSYSQLKDMLDRELASIENTNLEIEAILAKLSEKALTSEEKDVIERTIRASINNTSSLQKRMK